MAVMKKLRSRSLPELEDFHAFARTHRAPISGWPQVVLMIAGLYNILLGLWVICFPSHYFILNSIPLIHLNLWQYIGMIVGVYGIGYMIAATDISRHWPITLLGLLGKTFGLLGVLFGIYQSELSTYALIFTFFNDLIWLIPFSLILLKVINRYWRVQQQIHTSSGQIITDYQALLSRSHSEKVLLVFLRHFGCVFCQEALINLASDYKKIRRNGITPVIVSMGSQDKIEDFFRSNGIENIVQINDDEQVLYSFFEVKRGSLLETFSPAIAFEAREVLKRLNLGINKLAGDGFQLSACFLLENGVVLKEHRNHNVSNRYSYADFVLDDKDAVSPHHHPEVTLYFARNRLRIAERVSSCEIKNHS